MSALEPGVLSESELADRAASLGVSFPPVDKNGVRLRYPAVLRADDGTEFEVYAGWLDGAGTNVTAYRLPRCPGAESTTRLNSGRYEYVGGPEDVTA